MVRIQESERCAWLMWAVIVLGRVQNTTASFVFPGESCDSRIPHSLPPTDLEVKSFFGRHNDTEVAVGLQVGSCVSALWRFCFPS